MIIDLAALTKHATPENRKALVREYHAKTGLYLGVQVCCLKCSKKFDSALGVCPVCGSEIVKGE